MAGTSSIFKAVIGDSPENDEAALQGVVNGQRLMTHAIDKEVVSDLTQAVAMLGTMAVAALIHAVDHYCDPEDKNDQFNVMVGWLHSTVEDAAADLSDDDVCEKVNLALTARGAVQ